MVDVPVGLIKSVWASWQNYHNFEHLTEEYVASLQPKPHWTSAMASKIIHAPYAAVEKALGIVSKTYEHTTVTAPNLVKGFIVLLDIAYQHHYAMHKAKGDLGVSIVGDDSSSSDSAVASGSLVTE